MNLSYEIEGEKYIILDNDHPWIVQENYFPYPGATLEESAQNHIEQILEDNNKPQQPNEMEALKLALAELAETQETERLQTKIALAELAESMSGGGK